VRTTGQGRRRETPSTASLAPVLVGRAAAGALAMLERERTAERLYYYRRIGTEDDWNVWLNDRPDQLVPVPTGGRRLTLHEWCLSMYPILLAAKGRGAEELRTRESEEEQKGGTA
jgi:hypothetical protein